MPASVEDAALAAGRRVVTDRRQRILNGQDLIVETTLSGHGLLKDLAEASSRGFSTALHYLFLPDPDTCVQRVANRVQNGGHAIPTDTIRRRYLRGLALLPAYIAAVERAWIWNAAEEPRVIATKTAGELVVVQDELLWDRLRTLCGDLDPPHPAAAPPPSPARGEG